MAFANQKGGVGKTTTLINLSAALVEKGYYPVLIDLDPQANLTTGVGVDPDAVGFSTADLLMDERALLPDALIPCSLPGVKIAPSSRELANFDIRMADRENRERMLSRLLESDPEDRDFVFVDCPPSLNLLTVNALTAVGWVLVPVQCYYYSLNGLNALMRTIGDIREVYNPELRVLGVLANAYETGTRVARGVKEALDERFEDLVFNTVIRKSVKVAEAPHHGRSLLQYSSSHDVSGAYRSLADEFLARMG